MRPKQRDPALISLEGAQSDDIVIHDIAGGDITHNYHVYQVHVQLTPKGEVIHLGVLRIFPNKLQFANRLYPASAVSEVVVQVRERWKWALSVPVSLIWMLTWFSIGGYELQPLRHLVLVPLSAIYLSLLWCAVVCRYRAALTHYLVIIRMTWFRRIRLQADSYAHAVFLKDLIDHRIGMAE